MGIRALDIGQGEQVIPTPSPPTQDFGPFYGGRGDSILQVRMGASLTLLYTSAYEAI